MTTIRELSGSRIRQTFVGGADGTWLVRILPDGRAIRVLPLLFGRGRIGIGRADALDFDDVWDYPSLARAVAAASVWFGVDEPDGWHRHPRTRRFREDGDPARERIREL